MSESEGIAISLTIRTEIILAGYETARSRNDHKIISLVALLPWRWTAEMEHRGGIIADAVARFKITPDNVKPAVLRRVEAPLSIRPDRLHLAATKRTAQYVM
jgi:hypothetical protein